MKTVSADQFESALKEALNDYEKDVSKEVTNAVVKVGRKVPEYVKDAASKIGGTEYKNSFVCKVNRKKRLAEATIYSPKHYQLTHLLENGHYLVYFGKPTGKMTRAFPHWAQAEAKAIEELEKAVREAIQQ